MTEVERKIGTLSEVEDLPKEETTVKDELEDEEREKKWYEYNLFMFWPYLPF